MLLLPSKDIKEIRTSINGIAGMVEILMTTDLVKNQMNLVDNALKFTKNREIFMEGKMLKEDDERVLLEFPGSLKS